jgi:hypothetical protein
MDYKFDAYLKEILEEYVEIAIEYGRNPTDENELALCEVAELMYKALEINQK